MDPPSDPSLPIVTPPTSSTLPDVGPPVPFLRATTYIAPEVLAQQEAEYNAQQALKTEVKPEPTSTSTSDTIKSEPIKTENVKNEQDTTTSSSSTTKDIPTPTKDVEMTSSSDIKPEVKPEPRAQDDPLWARMYAHQRLLQYQQLAIQQQMNGGGPIAVQCHKCFKYRHVTRYEARILPDGNGYWECAFNAVNPSQSSCHQPENMVEAQVISYGKHSRIQSPYNYASLGILPFTEQVYDVLYQHDDWTRWETLTLLDTIRAEGLDDWDVIAKNRILAVRHTAEQCQARFLQILAMATLYGQSIHTKDQRGSAQKNAIADQGMLSAVHARQAASLAARSKRQSTRRKYYGNAGDDDDEDDRKQVRSSRVKKVVKYTDKIDETEFENPDYEEKAPVLEWKIEKILAKRKRRVKEGEESLGTGHTVLEEEKLREQEEKQHAMLEDKLEEKEAATSSSDQNKTTTETTTTATDASSDAIGTSASTSDATATSTATSTETKSENKEEKTETKSEATPMDTTSETTSTTAPAESKPDTTSATTSESAPSSTPATTETSTTESSTPAATETSTPAVTGPVDAVTAAAAATSAATTKNAADIAKARLRALRQHIEEESTLEGVENTDEGVEGPDGIRIVTDANGVRWLILTEYLVKVEGVSYLHCEWLTLPALQRKFGQRTATDRVKRFEFSWAKTQASNMDLYGGEYFDPRFVIVDRIIASKEVDNTEHGGVGKSELYLVKWQGLSYSQATWERKEDVNDEMKIAEFLRFNRPHLEDQTPTYTAEMLHARKSRWYLESKAYKNGNKLRDYQIQGVNWLINCWHDDRNCILADEMGLGKTVQCVAFLEHIRTVELIHGPFIVVVPLSTVPHWKREVETWTDMNCVIYHDPLKGKESRRIIREHEFYYPGTRKIKFNLMVTTYEVLLSDIDDLKKIEWQHLIVDEGHRAKNKQSRLMAALKDLKCDRRLLLTGTPIQNNTNELFTLLNFLEPDIFASSSSFEASFGNLQESEQVAALQARIRPYMLRRMKETVEKSIPPKEETIIDIELTTIQKKYYRAIYEKNIQFLRKGCSSANMPRLLNVEMELRKCCNHPWLIAGSEQKEVLENATDDEYFQKTIQASGKMVLLDKLLPKLKKDGHRVLIFSQMIQVLDILQEYLEYKGFTYERLDGAVTGNQRDAAIERFTRPGSKRFVFLLSTRAGGMGLNLATADTVIIYDSDWNPQQDMQAQARAHRIGQKSKVSVYRLVTRNTYESEMFMRASKKLGLDHAVLTNIEVGRGELQDDEKEGIDKMLKLGAYGVLNDRDDTDAQKFSEEDIDVILAKRARTVQAKIRGEGDEEEAPPDGDSAARFVFNKMTFTSEQSDTQIDVNDANFWEKLLPASESQITPDHLLAQLTTRQAMRDANSRQEFWNHLTKCCERLLEKKRVGEYVVEMERMIDLLITVAAMSQFSKAQIRQVNAWRVEAEQRVERKGRRSQKEEENQLQRRQVKSRTRTSKRSRRHKDDDDDGGALSNDDVMSDDAFEADESLLDDDAFHPAPSRGIGMKAGKKTQSKINADICDVCHRSGALLGCEGDCFRWFHLACIGKRDVPTEEPWLCNACTAKRQCCLLCGKHGPVVHEVKANAHQHSTTTTTTTSTSPATTTTTTSTTGAALPEATVAAANQMAALQAAGFAPQLVAQAVTQQTTTTPMDTSSSVTTTTAASSTSTSSSTSSESAAATSTALTDATTSSSTDTTTASSTSEVKTEETKKEEEKEEEDTTPLVDKSALPPPTPDDKPVRKCTVPTCGRFYHVECAKKEKFFHFFGDSNNFRCSLHYCYLCGQSGEATGIIFHCQTCATGLHLKCYGVATNIARLTKKNIYCPNCYKREAYSDRGAEAVDEARTYTQLPPVRERNLGERGKGRRGRPFGRRVKLLKPGEYNVRMILDDEVVYDNRMFLFEKNREAWLEQQKRKESGARRKEPKVQQLDENGNPIKTRRPYTRKDPAAAAAAKQKKQEAAAKKKADAANGKRKRGKTDSPAKSKRSAADDEATVQQLLQILTPQQIEAYIDQFGLRSDKWCRYCGARATASWHSGPWTGTQGLLCATHFAAWSQRTIDLSMFPTPPSGVINSTENTEARFIAQLVWKATEDLRRAKGQVSSDDDEEDEPVQKKAKPVTTTTAQPQVQPQAQVMTQQQMTPQQQQEYLRQLQLQQYQQTYQAAYQQQLQQQQQLLAQQQAQQAQTQQQTAQQQLLQQQYLQQLMMTNPALAQQYQQQLLAQQQAQQQQQR